MSEAAHEYANRVEAISSAAKTLLEKLEKLGAVANTCIPLIEEAQATAQTLQDHAKGASGLARSAIYQIEDAEGELGKPEIISPAQSSMRTATTLAAESKQDLERWETRVGAIAASTGVEVTRLDELKQQLEQSKGPLALLMTGSTGNEEEPTVSNVQSLAAGLANEARQQW